MSVNKRKRSEDMSQEEEFKVLFSKFKKVLMSSSKKKKLVDKLRFLNENKEIAKMLSSEEKKAIKKSMELTDLSVNEMLEDAWETGLFEQAEIFEAVKNKHQFLVIELESLKEDSQNDCVEIVRNDYENNSS